jgi:crotonobetaine/carnitine-CoA ligase
MTVPIALSKSERTVPNLLKVAASRFGDRPCLSDEQGSLSYNEVLTKTALLSGALALAGIEVGDRIALICENRREALLLFLSCAWLGVSFVPINPATRGIQFDHIINNLEPKIIILEEKFMATLEALSAIPNTLHSIWTLDKTASTSWRSLPISALSQGEIPMAVAKIDPSTPVAILYTSGTTGPPKGVICPNGQFIKWGEVVGGFLKLTHDDTCYTCLPLFHTNALNAFIQSMLNGSNFFIGPKFSVSRFWHRMVDSGATVTYLLGAMITMLMSAEPSPIDQAHRVRVSLAPGTQSHIVKPFEERFGLLLLEAHGMTETNAAIGPRDGQQRVGLMGRVIPGFSAKVVDFLGFEVIDGVPGELLLRADDSYSFASGYWRMPEATISATRELWFHSGDRVIREDGEWFRFVDRIKDVIRRRGENISAWEVEQALQLHPQVAAASVIPVPSELGEDEVMAFVVPKANAVINEVELLLSTAKHIAYFAVPRFVDFIEALPLTETGKVKKYELRERGVQKTTWDAQKVGFNVPR